MIDTCIKHLGFSGDQFYIGENAQVYWQDAINRRRTVSLISAWHIFQCACFLDHNVYLVSPQASLQFFI